MLDEPLLEGDLRERDLLLAFEALAPLLELRDLLLVDFAFALAFGAFGFDDDFARFGADSFRDLGFALAFVWAIVPLSSQAVP
ncbi:MAG TPA: hypothetical protein VF255_08150 [Solirubrobacterales bacterium]